MVSKPLHLLCPCGYIAKVALIALSWLLLLDSVTVSDEVSHRIHPILRVPNGRPVPSEAKSQLKGQVHRAPAEAQS